jgi:2'-5' RNA ligase
VALETDAPPVLLELHRRLASRLARSPRARPGDRFLPHLTLCRFGNAARAERIADPVDLAPFPIDRVSLMRSVLWRAGATHTVAASFPLDAAAGTTGGQ